MPDDAPPPSGPGSTPTATRNEPVMVPRGPAAPGGGRGDVRHRRGVTLIVAGVLAVAVVAAATVVLVHMSRLGSPAATTRTGKGITASNASLMGLVTLRHQQAPNFTLTDQNGKTFSLAQLNRNHVVVLGFMDDKCHDICPIVAQELVDAHHDLGARASSVDFVAVNVNAGHPSTATLRSFMDERGHGIATLPDFYYMTGTPSTLKKVWTDYHIRVIANPKTGVVVHSDRLYFLAPGGAEDYRATPFANMRKNGTGWLPTPVISQWGRGIAQYATAAG